MSLSAQLVAPNCSVTGSHVLEDHKSCLMTGYWVVVIVVFILMGSNYNVLNLNGS